jgi:5-methylcytosine-specific restriction endonuclease McrA
MFRQSPKGKILQLKKDALRRTRRRAASDEKISVQDIDFLKNIYSNTCAYCGCNGKLTIDHLVPISKDGKHKLTNLIPACHTCNSSKSHHEVYEWYWNQEFFTEDRLVKLIRNLLKIHEYRSTP